MPEEADASGEVLLDALLTALVLVLYATLSMFPESFVALEIKIYYII